MKRLIARLFAVWQRLPEFLRYACIGGVCAVLDLLTLVLFTEVVFGGREGYGYLAVSVAAGFVVGIVSNYLLSLLLVFNRAEQLERGKTMSAFLLYALVGVIGFFLTELLMHFGVRLTGQEGYWYVAVSCVVKVLVLIWNYLGRKILVYRRH